jgi:hypothetical protein
MFPMFALLRARAGRVRGNTSRSMGSQRWFGAAPCFCMLSLRSPGLACPEETQGSGGRIISWVRGGRKIVCLRWAPERSDAGAKRRRSSA